MKNPKLKSSSVSDFDTELHNYLSVSSGGLKWKWSREWDGVEWNRMGWNGRASTATDNKIAKAKGEPKYATMRYNLDPLSDLFVLHVWETQRRFPFGFKCCML